MAMHSVPADDYFELDEEHPIPNLDVVDVWSVKKGGGSRMFIIIASPLRDDTRSLERLMRKFDQYLAWLKSDECFAKCGQATSENTQIIVVIHPDSSPVAFELLDRSRRWIQHNNATLVIQTHGIVGVEPEH